MTILHYNERRRTIVRLFYVCISSICGRPIVVPTGLIYLFICGRIFFVALYLFSLSIYYESGNAHNYFSYIGGICHDRQGLQKTIR